MQQMAGGNNMMQQILSFGRNFQGNPQQAVMNLVASGQMSNSQLQQLMQQARQMMGMFR